MHASHPQSAQPRVCRTRADARSQHVGRFRGRGPARSLATAAVRSSRCWLQCERRGIEELLDLETAAGDALLVRICEEGLDRVAVPLQGVLPRTLWPGAWREKHTPLLGSERPYPMTLLVGQNVPCLAILAAGGD